VASATPISAVGGSQSHPLSHGGSSPPPAGCGGTTPGPAVGVAKNEVVGFSSSSFFNIFPFLFLYIYIIYNFNAQNSVILG
jgi:hypothetical protein